MLQIRTDFISYQVPAFLIGAAFPLMLFGRSFLQGGLALAFIVVLIIEAHRGTLSIRSTGHFQSLQGMMILLLAVLWLPGLINSPDVSKSFITWIRTFFFISAAVLIKNYLSQRPQAWCACGKVLIGSLFVVSMIVLFALVPLGELIISLKKMPDVSPIEPPVFKAFGSIAMCLIPIVLLYGNKLGGHWTKAGFIVSILAVIIIFFLRSYSALVGACVMMGISAILVGVRHPRYRIAPSIVLIAMITSMFYLSWNYESPYFNYPDVYLPEWIIDPHRQIIWRYTFEQYLAAPWFGNGINTINLIPGAHEIIPGIEYEYIPSHPHNWILEIMAETGAFGLLACLLTLDAFIRPHISGDRGFLKSGNLPSLCIIALSSAFLTASLFNFSIWSSWWLLTYFVLFAIVVSVPDREQHKDQ
jgi:O-antigen ligase